MLTYAVDAAHDLTVNQHDKKMHASHSSWPLLQTAGTPCFDQVSQDFCVWDVHRWKSKFRSTTVCFCIYLYKTVHTACLPVHNQMFIGVETMKRNVYNNDMYIRHLLTFTADSEKNGLLWLWLTSRTSRQPRPFQTETSLQVSQFVDSSHTDIAYLPMK